MEETVSHKQKWTSVEFNILLTVRQWHNLAEVVAVWFLLDFVDVRDS